MEVPWKGLPVTQLAILESWLTLVEGVVSAVVTCPRTLQPDVLHVLNEILDSLLLCPGIKLSVVVCMYGRTQNFKNRRLSPQTCDGRQFLPHHTITSPLPHGG